ncbi:hypothetical protein LZ30DRAFT_237987 [Colletotrichum cereale]|nr:hypothetical protein LZ30DRAFT_237987 [Colletotrichum cereale]
MCLLLNRGQDHSIGSPSPLFHPVFCQVGGPTPKRRARDGNAEGRPRWLAGKLTRALSNSPSLYRIAKHSNPYKLSSEMAARLQEDGMAADKEPKTQLYARAPRATENNEFQNDLLRRWLRHDPQVIDQSGRCTGRTSPTQSTPPFVVGIRTPDIDQLKGPLLPIAASSVRLTGLEGGAPLTSTHIRARLC